MLNHSFIDRMWQVGFPGNRKPEVLHARMFIKKCPGTSQGSEEGREKNRIGQKDHLSCDKA